MINSSTIKTFNSLTNNKTNQFNTNQSSIHKHKPDKQTKYLSNDKMNNTFIKHVNHNKENINKTNFKEKKSAHLINLSKPKQNMHKIYKNQNLTNFIKNIENCYFAHEDVYSKQIEYEKFSIFDNNDSKFVKKIFDDQIEKNSEQILFGSNENIYCVDSSDELIIDNGQVLSATDGVKIIGMKHCGGEVEAFEKMNGNGKRYLYC